MRRPLRWWMRVYFLNSLLGARAQFVLFCTRRRRGGGASGARAVGEAS